MTAPPYAMGVQLNLAAYKDKARLDAKAFDARGDEELRAMLPLAFDARKHWKRCPSIGRVVDQGCCGSCWAYASAMVMTDRQCILANEHFEYSAQHLLVCSKTSNHSTPCKGGDPADAFDFWVTRGVVSGGEFNSYVGCMPYIYAPAGNQCRASATPLECLQQCQISYPRQFKKDLHFGERYMLLPQNRPVIMQSEILRGGPIVAILDAYEDFKCYESGVYEHVAGELEGAHAVRLIGWGTENGVPYWLAANSWGKAWGERGLFKVRRGTNECNIESLRVATGFPSTVDVKGDAETTTGQQSAEGEASEAVSDGDGKDYTYDYDLDDY
ncbi:cathepsin B-like [Thrips palmi]|uniref:Cathepsin B-like n=1 Tax=Thrips palmi TaxID=161013 RepID=A0A6P8YTA5_THRPL|nr:cathepsin B-like [Thrips palmi]